MPLITFVRMLGVKMGPPLFQSKYFPRSILVLLSKLLMKADKAANTKKSKSSCSPHYGYDYPTFEELAPTLRNDIKVTSEMSGERNFDTLADIDKELFIIGASRSPEYLKNAVRVLKKILPHSMWVELQGYDHGVTGNRPYHGDPDIVARELRRFFSGEEETQTQPQRT